jgi:signal transduction histidine kinase/ActR/RegA family two-component response regulator
VTADRSRDFRLVFLATTAKDAEMTQAMLAPLGIRVDTCRSFDTMLEEVRAGAGALLLAEEATSDEQNAALATALAAQPPWSDLPVLILARRGADSAEAMEAVRTLGNVTLLERPVRVAALVSAVRTAIRARERQYQIREHLAGRARAETSLRLADQRKDEFLATLGHELRNPLAPLLTALQLLRTVGSKDPVVAHVGNVMDRQINHLVRLVDDLLEVSRITRGLIQINREPLDLAVIVQSAVDTSRPALDGGDHHLSIELPPEPVIVHGDAVRLTQVVANLLTNAAKYTNPGGRIVVRLHREDGSAILSVRDNGIGIAADQLSAIFEMFTQVDRSSRRAQGGLGIGLTLVRSLVGMHGGRVEARSDGLGKGSEFVVELSAVDQGVPEQPAASPEPFPRRRILVVDDNRDAADTLAQLLTMLGAVVSVAYSGRAALDALEDFQPDSVLLDIGMPDMHGYEVARRIRASTGFSGILLIALTGWGQEHDQRQSRAAGFDHHVVKPPDINRLRELFISERSSAAPTSSC